MEYFDLVQNREVSFEPSRHVYTDLCTGGCYSGVTSILKAVLFSNKYSDVPQEILRRAAQRGSAIHALCEKDDAGHLISGIPTEEEVYQRELDGYRAIKQAYGIRMIANEYLISDGMYRVASMIDCVDSNLNLYDIKTTYQLDTEYVSWQLSFYAWLFETQNPSLNVGKLYAIHLRGETHALVEVPRRTASEVLEVLKAYGRGETLSTASAELVEQSSGDLARLYSVEQAIIDLKHEIEAHEAKKKGILDGMKKEMMDKGIKKLESPRLLVTLVPDSTTRTFDKKAFEEAHPGMMDNFMKEGKRAGYVKITIREQATA